MNDKITNELVEHKDTPKKPEVSLIVKIMMYLYNMKIPFSARHGLKKIYYFYLRDPITKNITKEIKECFKSFGYDGYASGEYPFVENPEQYNYLKYVDFNDIYSRYIDGAGKQGDILIAISTSGNSENIVKAINTANDKKMITVSLTGKTGGALKNISKYLLNVPCKDTPIIQESHIMIGHIICEMVEAEMFSGKYLN